MKFLITSALLAALGLAAFAPPAEAGFIRRRDGTPREPARTAVKALVCCHRNR